MKRLLPYILLLITLATSLAWAGVVEDAEEELKKMGRGQERLVVSGLNRRDGGTPSRRVRSRTQKSRSGSERAREGRTRQPDMESGSASHTSGSTTGVSAESETEMPSGRTKKDRLEKNKGRLTSMGVVLLLALLVLMATAASRRLGSNE